MPRSIKDVKAFSPERESELVGRAKILLIGLGGVGAFAAEGLARCGVGSLTLVDHGVFTEADLGRNPFALGSVLGKSRVMAAKERIFDIDREILLHTYDTFFTRETADLFDFQYYDYIVEAADSPDAKLLVMEKAAKYQKRVISCMELPAGGMKLLPVIRPLYSPAAGAMQKSLQAGLGKKRNPNAKVLCAPRREITRQREGGGLKEQGGGPAVGTVLKKGIAGMMIAEEVIRDILRDALTGGKNE